jgi:hypothetical protein
MSVATEPTTSLAATVADESEEIKAESSGTSTSAPEPTATATATVNENVNENGETPEVKEEKPDPNALPEDACVTLYLQNLNEKVQIPGKSSSPRQDIS